MIAAFTAASEEHAGNREMRPMLCRRVTHADQCTRAPELRGRALVELEVQSEEVRMAGIAAGSSPSGRREFNHQLPLVPFIDFLLCLIAFLLVTAVWSQMARLSADARVGGASGSAPEQLATELHVSVRDDSFLLRWQAGSTVLESTEVARKAVTLADGSLRYPELGRVADAQWRVRGAHRAASDAVQDRAVLHTPNALEFREVTAVLDALAGPKRKLDLGRRSVEIPAFSVAFATD
jgi:biopolymer transport protein ExbD